MRRRTGHLSILMAALLSFPGPSDALPQSVVVLAEKVESLLTKEQLDSYAHGADPTTIVLADGQTLAAFLELQVKGSTFDLSWYTVDGGGGTSSGGDFFVVGTAGQPDTGISSGGNFELVGGFAHGLLGGCPDPNAVFCDDFESGDTTRWTVSVGTVASVAMNASITDLWSER